MTKEKKNDALATRPVYAIAKADPQELQAVLAANIGSGAMSEWDLTRIKVPAGGAIGWEIPTPDGPTTAQEITGIVVHWSPRHSYWQTGYGESGGGTPPDCTSQNGIIGVGSPGGGCVTCQENAFGSAIGKDGEPTKRKACQNKVALFLLTPESILPTVLVLPPTSLKAWKTYCNSLTGRVKPYYGVETRFTLEKRTSKSGFEHSIVVFRTTRDLEGEEIDNVQKYAKSLGSLFSSFAIEEEG